MHLALTIAQIMNLFLTVPGCRALCPAATCVVFFKVLMANIEEVVPVEDGNTRSQSATPSDGVVTDVNTCC